ncbi:DNA polymerase/3'-5' exonuclease PolX [Methanohalophilus mahii]|uniref:DNA polymerase beta n=1 Tax=Methanohalophilus mahii (strain ATCC 35705 / DSM 5219 / SLP) TaxID=547558 RepID=D5EBP7_METMS|nr:DNA polymerase/3'-5' exonuclease PolX [Methanohalophilus mahii]ADE36598.1 PHP domain protein [Methanohalophilus mahii DSM 5219]
MINRDIAKLLYEIADIFEYKEVEWKPRAYRKAARKIGDMREDISGLYSKKGREGLENIPGVGSRIADHIVEYIEAGSVREFEKIRKETPRGASNIIKIRGLGPKKAKKLMDELDIQSIPDLKEAINNQEIRKLEGFGKKTEENLDKAISQYEKSHERMLLPKATDLAEEIISYMEENTTLKKIDYAGSLRRMKETIGDIDILVVASDPEEVMDAFVNFENVDEVESRGKTRSTIILQNGGHIDLRVVPESSYGAALQYFTGSKDHNIELRNLALSKGYKLSEYGLFKEDSKKKLEGKKEDRIYGKLGLSFIPPELRENRGELECAKNTLPSLVELEDIRGDLHVHTSYSDGTDSLNSMIAQADKLGYEYIGITDHSRSRKIAGGLGTDKVKEQWKEIDGLRDDFDIEILKGIEVDILPDGSLDCPDDILEEMDIVVGSIHSGYKSPKKKMTERIITALQNEFLHVLGHPTSRKIGIREAYEVDLDKIFETAAENGKLLEINSQPERLDLNDNLILQAKEYDLKFCISSDSHSSAQLDFMKYGVGQARRGWLTKDDVANTYSLKELKRLID